jgi:hypothetical protein
MRGYIAIFLMLPDTILESPAFLEGDDSEDSRKEAMERCKQRIDKYASMLIMV